MSLPTLTGVGRLTEDPELRFSASGVAVAKVRLAFNSRRKDEGGNWVDGDVYYVDGTAFKQMAESITESLSRGVEVHVSGRMKTRQFETREGEKRTVQELIIDSIGPSLAWATATVKKVDRSGGSSGKPAGGSDDPWASAAPAGSAGSDFDSEPPF